MDKASTSLTRISIHWLLPLWIVALVGYFSPWISRQPYSAALNWNAYDLYDAVMLLPEIETGAISVNLQTLRAPLLGLALLLSFHLAKAPLHIRLIGAVIGGSLAFITLPPYPLILTAWRTPGWRVPFWWALGTGVFCFAAIWVLPKIRRYIPWFGLFIYFFSALPAAQTLNRLLPALRILHDAPVNRGWGFWMTELGMLGYVAGFWLAEIVFSRLNSEDEISEDVMPEAFTTVYSVKARYESQLMAKPNVLAVGIGMRDGYPDPVIIVSVTEKVPDETLSSETRVPRVLDGVVICVEEIGEPIPQTEG